VLFREGWDDACEDLGVRLFLGDKAGQSPRRGRSHSRCRRAAQNRRFGAGSDGRDQALPSDGSRSSGVAAGAYVAMAWRGLLRVVAGSHIRVGDSVELG